MVGARCLRGTFVRARICIVRISFKLEVNVL